MTTEIAASDKLVPELQTAINSDREYKLPPDQKGNKVMDYTKDPRFKGITPFPSRVWLSSPTMHGDEQHWVDEAIQTNWVSTVGANIDTVEKRIADYIGVQYAVGLSSGTSALHLATRLAGERLYGQPESNEGTLRGHKVFCSDVTFEASVNPVSYENGEAIFIDSERDTWNMSPEALEKAFELYPDVKLIVIVHLFGTPGKIDEIRRIADRHNALIVEDAAESFGATYRGRQTGKQGDFGVISFNGNKVITGSSGGAFLTNCKEDAEKVRKWSTQSRENAPWYHHREIGFNYRMSNIIAGVIRGQLPYLEEHVAQKREIYRRYQEGLRDLPVTMNPWEKDCAQPNFWLSCMLIDESAMAPMVRGDTTYSYNRVSGKSCPHEILEALDAFNAEGRPIWKPMHLQPIYRTHPFVTAEGLASEALIDCGKDVGSDLFRRGLCLPSDNKMTKEQQDQIIEIIHRCFL